MTTLRKRLNDVFDTDELLSSGSSNSSASRGVVLSSSGFETHKWNGTVLDIKSESQVDMQFSVYVKGARQD